MKEKPAMSLLDAKNGTNQMPMGRMQIYTPRDRPRGLNVNLETCLEHLLRMFISTPGGHETRWQSLRDGVLIGREEV